MTQIRPIQDKVVKVSQVIRTVKQPSGRLTKPIYTEFIKRIGIQIIQKFSTNLFR